MNRVAFFFMSQQQGTLPYDIVDRRDFGTVYPHPFNAVSGIKGKNTQRYRLRFEDKSVRVLTVDQHGDDHRRQGVACRGLHTDNPLYSRYRITVVVECRHFQQVHRIIEGDACRPVDTSGTGQGIAICLIAVYHYPDRCVDIPSRDMFNRTQDFFRVDRKYRIIVGRNPQQQP